MIRYRYNQQLKPAAPFVHVTLQDPVGETTLTDLPAQLDTAADMSVVPANLVEQLQLVQLDSTRILGFGGAIRMLATHLVRLSLHGHEAVLIEVVSSAEEPHILLGRDVLNRHRILFDGPRGIVEVD